MSHLETAPRPSLDLHGGRLAKLRCSVRAFAGWRLGVLHGSAIGPFAARLDRDMFSAPTSHAHASPSRARRGRSLVGERSLSQGVDLSKLTTQ